MRCAVFAASAAVHLALFALLAPAMVDDRGAPVAHAGIARAPVVVSAALEVEILPPPPPPPPPRRVTTSTGSAHAAVASRGTSRGANIEPAIAAPAEPIHGADSPYMHMRGAQRPEIGDTGDTLEHIAAQHDPAPPAAEAAHSGMLHDSGGDRATIYDTVTSVSVEPDGTAHFHDKPSAGLRGPHVSRKGFGDMLTTWYADPYAMTRVGTTQDLPEHMQAVPGECDAWGSCMQGDPGPGIGRGAGPEAVIGGGDITDWFMRRHGIDPYASRKLKLLDATREERFARGSAYRAERLQHSGEDMERNLAALFAAKAPAVEKRELLFELWDECAEGDDLLGRAGSRARAHVIGWIDAHIPKGAADAFTDDELAAMNARRTSKQVFAPYRPTMW